MPRNFKFAVKKNDPKGCDASRCKEAPTHTAGRYRLCTRHYHMLEESEIEQLNNSQPEESQIQAEIQPMADEAELILEQLECFHIEDEEAAQFAGEMLQDVHKKLNEVEKKEKKATKPLHEAKKEIHSWFKPTKDFLKKSKGILKQRISSWIERQDAQRVAALMSGDTEKALSVPVDNVPDSVRTSYVWDFEVENQALIPREYLCIDVPKIKALIKSSDPETLAIPGIRIFQKSQLSVRS